MFIAVFPLYLKNMDNMVLNCNADSYVLPEMIYGLYNVREYESPPDSKVYNYYVV